MKQKIVQLGFIIVITCAQFLIIAGCGQNEALAAKDISEQLSMKLESVKDSNSDVNKIIKSNLSELSAIGLDVDSYIVSWLEDYYYSIGEIAIDGDNAIATVTINIKQLGPILDRAITDINNLNTYNSSFSELTAGFMSKVRELMQQALDEAPLEAVVINFAFMKTDGAWIPDSSFKEVLRFALTSNSVLF
ncbi:MAG: hypothetical protein LBG97_07685 [Coriobacteriales bacterium]|jgi:hypothetical protein|nr:hypothetical protein [Coriobacteriales bacterium]